MAAVTAVRPTARPAARPITGPTVRDRYVDLLRAGSLLVVVAWHWVFTVVDWQADGPHASNPLGSTRGLWVLTWLFQVMPVFFWVGGFVHAGTYERSGGYGAFLRKRLGRLLLPALVAIGGVGAFGLLAAYLMPGAPVARSVILVLSPLWFLGVYALLVLATPIAAWAHRRFGEVALVALAGLAVTSDLLRFRFGVGFGAVLAWVAVWGFAHQLGFDYERLVAAPRRFAWCLVLGGLFALVALTSMGHYPRSMVGVPGEAISNMAPPTICIVALCVLQVGVALLVRPAALRLLERPAASRAVDWVSTNSMQLYLWHGVGFALAYGVVRVFGEVVGVLDVPGATTASWWLQRPLWVLLPALTTRSLLKVARRI